MPFIPVQPRLSSPTLVRLADRWMPCHSQIGIDTLQLIS